MRSVLVAAAAAITLHAVAFAQTPATIVQLDGLYPGGTSGAAAVNDAGMVVGIAGYSDTPGSSHAVVWLDGRVIDLGTLCGEPCAQVVTSSAVDVNEHGQVVGGSGLGDGTTRGFIWDRSAGMRALRPLDGDTRSNALGINNHGEAVGWSKLGLNEGQYRPVVWTADGTPREIPGWATGTARDINDAGQMVGLAFNEDGTGRGVQWEAGVLSDLPGLDCWLGGSPRPESIDRFGDVAGSMSCNGPTRAFRWVGNNLVDLGTQDAGTQSGVGGADSAGDSGEVVGSSPFRSVPFRTVCGYGERATLWKHGRVVDLGSLSAHPCARSGAAGVNTHGLVVGASALDVSPYSTAVVFTLAPDLARGSFGGTPRPIPGRIDAVHYDVGGPGVGYSDTSIGNNGEAYRWDDVDIKPSRHGGYAVGWLSAAEWLSYTVNVVSTGLYTIGVRIGSPLPGRTFHLEADGQDVTGPIAVPQVADWDEYETVTISGVSMTAGSQLLKVVMGPEDYADLQWIDFTAATAAPANMRIEAEDYDTGGPGYGYLDSTPGNEQGLAVYRNDDVDIKASADGGYAVGWLTADEWLAYTVTITDGGLYAMRARAGSPLAGRTFHVEIDGYDVTGTIQVPQTVGWDQYETLQLPAFDLSPGSHRVRFVMGPESFMDLQWIEIHR